MAVTAIKGLNQDENIFFSHEDFQLLTFPNYGSAKLYGIYTTICIHCPNMDVPLKVCAKGLMSFNSCGSGGNLGAHTIFPEACAALLCVLVLSPGGFDHTDCCIPVFVWVDVTALRGSVLLFLCACVDVRVCVRVCACVCVCNSVCLHTSLCMYLCKHALECLQI